jgi:hypothetical protein
MTFLTGRDMAVVALTFIRPLSLTRSRGGQLLSMSTPQSSIPPGDLRLIHRTAKFTRTHSD